tara:strand:+ start:4285 stop:4605 length:321 start_codon:yes stop_codon:yes gene_type:complete
MPSDTILKNREISEDKNIMNKFIHQQRYAERQKTRKGHAQVKVWVPEDKREELLSFANSLRKNFTGDEKPADSPAVKALKKIMDMADRVPGLEVISKTARQGINPD